MVWQVVQRVSVPVIGIGGIMTAEDALEFLIVGAKAVQIGTANFINPHATLEVIEGIKNYLTANKIKDVNEIIGTFQPLTDIYPPLPPSVISDVTEVDKEL